MGTGREYVVFETRVKGDEEEHESGKKEGNIRQRNHRVSACKKDKAGSKCKEENLCLYEKNGTEPRNHTKRITTLYGGEGVTRTGKKERMVLSRLIPPNNATYIGAVETKGDTYFYYQDEEGNFYYDSQQIRRFELEMREAQKRKQQRKWREKKRAI